MKNGGAAKGSNLPESEELKDTTQATSKRESNTTFSFTFLLFNVLNITRNFAFLAALILRKLTQMIFSSSKSMKKGATIVTLVIAVILAGHTVSAQVTNQPPPLNKVKVPEPDNIGDFIRNKTAAIALGKSLFWDMQLGTDGVQSCASCHFHAGADNRSKNQVNPGTDKTFNTGGGANYQLNTADFPFHRFSDPNSRDSTVVSDSNDVTGSQGVFKTKFVDVAPGSDKDKVTPLKDEVFNVNGTNVRQVTGRNSPTTINAVFNFRNFWDGRAQPIFNGVNGLGLKDPNAYVLKATKPRFLEDVQVRIKNSSLASQAVVPPLSALEVAAEDLPIAPFRVEESANNENVVVSDAETGRQVAELNPEGETISGSTDLAPPERRRPPSNNQPNNQPLKRIGRKLGKKLLALRPLNKQQVARDDSVLAPYTRFPRTGLNRSYEALIKDAFKPEWWNSRLIIRVNPETGERRFIRKPRKMLSTNEYTLMQYNFSLFFGLAVQAYEATLVSDQTPFDSFLAGNSSALTSQQQQGWQIFQGRGICFACHGGSELTTASVSSVTSGGRIRRVPFGARRVEDAGFFNIGVRPPQDDLGVGGKDELDNPLSESRLALNGKFKELLGEDPPVVPNNEQDLVADGAFKAPGLRNIAMTAPYMHNGGQLTLEQVVDFYSRGGDFGRNLPVLNLNPDDKKALVAFMKEGLTDQRVLYQRAPFDHPQLFIPNGHPGDQNSVTKDPNVKTQDGVTQATDQLLEIPAVGRNGSNTPIKNFLGT